MSSLIKPDSEPSISILRELITSTSELTAMQIRTQTEDSHPATLFNLSVHTPNEVINELRTAHNENNIEVFNDMLDTLMPDPKFDIVDLNKIMLDAIERDNVQFVESLLSHGLPVYDDYAPLAVKSRAKNVLEILLRKSGTMPSDSIELVRLLFSKRAPRDIGSATTGKDILEIILRQSDTNTPGNSIELLKSLLSNTGRSPEDTSLARSKAMDILETLLRESDINIPTADSIELVKLLVSDSPEDMRQQETSKAKNILERLSTKGWGINTPISDTQPPILRYGSNSTTQTQLKISNVSLCTQDTDMVTWLLDRGADPNQRCRIDLTPLSRAVRYASISTVTLLLESGGDVAKGQVLFHALERVDEDEIVEVLTLLLGKGAPINDTMYQHDAFSLSLYSAMGLGTVLHKATELGMMNVVRFLIREGIDPSIENTNGLTALDRARVLRSNEMVKILEGLTGP